MAGFLDELSPSYLGERRIDLTVDPSVTLLGANRSILVNVDYSRTLPEDVLLPLILIVQGPSAASYRRREIRRAKIDSFAFRPIEGGPHLVLLREAAHNRWYGRLRLTVEGEQLNPPSPQ